MQTPRSAAPATPATALDVLLQDEYPIVRWDRQVKVWGGFASVGVKLGGGWMGVAQWLCRGVTMSLV
jgi:hypothetical protein